MAISIEVGVPTFFAENQNSGGDAGAQGGAAAWDPVNKQILLVWVEFYDGADTGVYAQIGQVNGMEAVTFGSRVFIDNANSTINNQIAVCYDPTSENFLVAIEQAYLWVISVTGTTISSGSVYSGSTLEYGYSSSIMKAIDGHIVMFFAYGTTKGCACVVISISGLTMTIGTPLVFATPILDNNDKPGAEYHSGLNVFFAVWQDPTDKDLRMSVLTKSGMTMTEETQSSLFLDGTDRFNSRLAYNPATGKMICSWCHWYGSSTQDGLWYMEVDYVGGNIVAGTPYRGAKIFNSYLQYYYRASDMLYNSVGGVFNTLYAHNNRDLHIGAIRVDDTSSDEYNYLAHSSFDDKVKEVALMSVPEQYGGMLGLIFSNYPGDVPVIFPFISGDVYQEFWTNFKDQTEEA